MVLSTGTHEVTTWEAFEERISVLRSENPSDLATSPLLFRGQSHAGWSLTTTLERRVGTQIKVSEYYRKISSLRPEIETFTGNSWDEIPTMELERRFSEYDSGSLALTFGDLPAYNFLAHLRHHGFPSPLLDWSRSPYVAAFFAFDAPSHDEKASIYAYCERPNNTKSSSSESPTITGMGPRVKTHRRHFLQQSEYTICTFFEENWRFESHEEVFKRDNPHQDRLWKFNIPRSEGLKVLKKLDEYNINAFSLFGSEESLMSTLAARKLDFP